jgi:nucleotide-binding universal stress UspA family protein
MRISEVNGVSKGERIMNDFKQILFPVDFSDRSDAAAPFILSMARRWNSRVALLHVLPPVMPSFETPIPPYFPDYDPIDAAREVRQKLIDFGAKNFPKVDVTTDVRIGDPAAIITAHAADIGADLIAMPTHGYGPFRRMVLGSATASVLRKARCAVWTSAHAPEPSHRAHPAPRFILGAVDLTPESEKVIDAAVRIASGTGAALEILHIAPELEEATTIRAGRLREMLARAQRQEAAVVIETQNEPEQSTMANDNVADMLRQVALEKRADLVVIGRGELRRLFGGLRSNIFEIIREAPCPVLSV